MPKVIAYVGAGGKTSCIWNEAKRYRKSGFKVLVVTTTHMLVEPFTILETATTIGVVGASVQKQMQKKLLEEGFLHAGILVPSGSEKERKIGPLDEATYLKLCEMSDVVLVEADGSRHHPLKYPAEYEPVIPANTTELVIIMGRHGIGKPICEVVHRHELACNALGFSKDEIVTEKHVEKLFEVYEERCSTITEGVCCTTMIM